MPPSSQPAPIIFKLDNGEQMHTLVGTIFSHVNFLLFVEESSIHDFFATTSNLFTKEQYTLLSKRIINKRIKEIPMNQNHVIILLAIIYFTILMMESDSELKILIDSLESEASEKDITTTRGYILEFATRTLRDFKVKYKSNHAIIIAITKIVSFKLPTTKE